MHSLPLARILSFNVSDINPPAVAMEYVLEWWWKTATTTATDTRLACIQGIPTARLLSRYFVVLWTTARPPPRTASVFGTGDWAPCATTSRPHCMQAGHKATRARASSCMIPACGAVRAPHMSCAGNTRCNCCPSSKLGPRPGRRPHSTTDGVGMARMTACFVAAHSVDIITARTCGGVTTSDEMASLIATLYRTAKRSPAVGVVLVGDLTGLPSRVALPGPTGEHAFVRPSKLTVLWNPIYIYIYRPNPFGRQPGVLVCRWWWGRTDRGRSACTSPDRRWWRPRKPWRCRRRMPPRSARRTGYGRTVGLSCPPCAGRHWPSTGCRPSEVDLWIHRETD